MKKAFALFSLLLSFSAFSVETCSVSCRDGTDCQIGSNDQYVSCVCIEGIARQATCKIGVAISTDGSTPSAQGYSFKMKENARLFSVNPQ